MQRRQLLAAGASVIAVAIAGCADTESADTGGGGDADGAADTTSDEQGGETDTETSTEPAIELLEHEWTVIKEYESDAVDDTYGVVGTGQNNTDKRLDVFIEFRFYDSEDVQLETTTVSASGVQAGGKFKFEAMYLGDDASEVDRYEYGWDAYES